MEINTVYTRQRRAFGRPVNHFGIVESESLPGIESDSVMPTLFVERDPCDLHIQAVKDLSQSEVNTNSTNYVNLGMAHTEGGWPSEIDYTEKEQTVRFRKKVEKDEDYIRQVQLMGEEVEQSIMQNIAVDIYEDYFNQAEYMDHASEPPSARTLSVFKDPNEVKRTVCSISWYPDGGKKLAASFAIMQFQDWRMERMSNVSYIWDVSNPNVPDMELKPVSALCCVEYNPKDQHLLVGGSYNGLISCWDTRKGSTPVDTSIVEKSHRDPVSDISWVAGKTAFECVSTATDGQVLWWDTRKLGEPLEQLLLEDKAAGDGRLVGGVCLEYSTAGGKFLVGTENGTVIACNRKAKNPADRLGLVYEGHCGPIYALQRNPFWPKFFLTIGDWTVRLWNDELRGPVMTSKYFMNYVLDATWSPTRPGVFLSTKMDGTLDVWDYYHKQNDPTLTLQIDDDGLYTVSMQEAGSLLATGSVDGSVYLLELSPGLCQMQQNEKKVFAEMVDRESKREKNLEARAKELRAREKRMAEQHKEVVKEVVKWAEQEKQVEEAFWKAIDDAAKRDEEAGAS